MKTIASIDLGSNSILLLVAKITSNKRVIPIYQDCRTPRLAENLKQTEQISSRSLNRAIKDINDFKNIALSYGASEIFMVTTQAVRKARNKTEVVNKILDKTGIKPEIISGRQEAKLTYLGALTGISALKPERIMFDIGGGSTEFVYAAGKNIKKVHSLDLGAVDVTEKYQTQLPTNSENLDLIESEILEYLDKKLKFDSPDKFDLIGCGGSISACKLLDSKPANFNPNLIHGQALSLNALNSIIYDLAKMKLSDRKRVITFEPGRAEVIVAGGLILKAVLKYFDKRSVRVSTHNLRWGFLISKL